jgi:hypothetical protein
MATLVEGRWMVKDNSVDAGIVVRITALNILKVTFSDTSLLKFLVQVRNQKSSLQTGSKSTDPNPQGETHKVYSKSLPYPG